MTRVQVGMAPEAANIERLAVINALLRVHSECQAASKALANSSNPISTAAPHFAAIRRAASALPDYSVPEGDLPA